MDAINQRKGELLLLLLVLDAVEQIDAGLARVVAEAVFPHPNLKLCRRGRAFLFAFEFLFGIADNHFRGDFAHHRAGRFCRRRRDTACPGHRRCRGRAARCPAGRPEHLTVALQGLPPGGGKTVQPPGDLFEPPVVVSAQNVRAFRTRSPIPERLGGELSVPKQFGDPQGDKYGVDFSSPEAAWRTQLDPTSGGVWGYLEDTGVKPGMGLPEIYSAINAGAVGRMGASDANNGGAPGTVADKVAGMGPHRDKAAAFLGGTWTPNPDAGGGAVTMSTSGPSGGYGGGGTGGVDIASLLALQSDPWVAKKYGGVVDALMGQQFSRQNALWEQQQKMADPMYQAQLAELTAPKVNEYDSRAAAAAQYGLQPGTPEYQRFVLGGDPFGGTSGGAPASFQALAMQAEAGGLVPGTPEYQSFMLSGGAGNGTGEGPAAFQALHMQALAAGFPEGTPEYKEFMATRGSGLVEGARVRGESAANAEVAAPADIAVADRTLGYIDEVRNHPGKGQGTGLSSYGNWIPGTSGKDFQNRVDQLKSGAFLSAIDELRGMGSLSNAEGQTATAAITRMDTSTSEEEFNAALDDYEAIVNLGGTVVPSGLRALQTLARHWPL